MKIGEIDFRAAGAVQGLHIGGQLNQIAGHKPRGQTQMPKSLHQQPAGISTRALVNLDGLVGCLHTRFHADFIIDQLFQLRVESDNEVNCLLFADIDAINERLPLWPGRSLLKKRSQLLTQGFVVLKRVHFRGGFDEEFERIDNRHFGDQIDFDAQFFRLLFKDRARLEVSERILLPIQKVFLR